MQRLITWLARFGYEGLLRPLVFRLDAQSAHQHALRLLAALDSADWANAGLKTAACSAFKPFQREVGGVALVRPMILAAGLVKGEGYASEAEALAAVERGDNVMPGWRSVPSLVRLVEYGSFTRYPRLGNAGVVLWRDVATQSTQNRVGLKNPGAQAAAAFLQRHQANLPSQFGINLAVSPGVADPLQAQQEIIESLQAFISRRVIPIWFTLNLSCPNTDDDPHGHQTAAQARELSSAMIQTLRTAGIECPVWVKISPDLSDAQYEGLLATFETVGVRAVIATNTLPAPAPDQAVGTAGVGGGRLRRHALAAVRKLVAMKQQHGYTVDIIGCGGVLDGISYHQYQVVGVQAVQYWSALVYRGPLAAAIIEMEAQKYE